MQTPSQLEISTAVPEAVVAKGSAARNDYFSLCKRAAQAEPQGLPQLRNIRESSRGSTNRYSAETAESSAAHSKIAPVTHHRGHLS